MTSRTIRCKPNWFLIACVSVCIEVFSTLCLGQSVCAPALDLNSDGTTSFGDMVSAKSLADLVALHQCLDIPRGDVNGDRQIGFQDLLVISEHFHPTRPQVGEPMGYSDADLNLDQVVDLADYAIMHSNFAETRYVPEANPPSTGVLDFGFNRFNRLELRADGLKLGGIEVTAPEQGIHHFVCECRMAEPFFFTLSFSEETFAAVSVFNEDGPVGVVINGVVPTHLQFREGYDFAGATLRWFEVGSQSIHSISLPEPSGGGLLTSFIACGASVLPQCRSRRISRKVSSARKSRR